MTQKKSLPEKIWGDRKEKIKECLDAFFAVGQVIDSCTETIYPCYLEYTRKSLTFFFKFANPVFKLSLYSPLLKSWQKKET